MLIDVWKNKFSEQWFKEGAIKNIEQLQKNVWDFSSSVMSYNPEGVKACAKLGKTAYGGTVHDEESLFIKSIASQIIKDLPHSFSYVDLGPGSGEKSILLLEACKNEGKQINYIPVDVSKFLLDKAVEATRKTGFISKPKLATFEELLNDKKFLNSLGPEKFISLGLTYINYEPTEIHQLLKKLMGSRGQSFITVQLRDRINLKEVKKLYFPSTAARRKIILSKLKLLDINKADIKNFEVTDDIKIFAILKRVPNILKSKGIKGGDKILVWKTFRPTLKNFISNISQDFQYTLYDKRFEFVAAVLKQKDA